MQRDANIKGIGIIGYGGFGEFMRAAWDVMDNAKVVAVCDTDPSRRPNGVEFYSNADELLANPAVDIVSVATPPGSHKDLAIKALAAGKHVLIEKPLALSECDANAIKQAAERAGCAASVNFVLRHNPIVDALSKIISAGVFGRLRRVDLRNYATRDQLPDSHWFWNPDVSGRILLEHGVHFFDLAAQLIGSRARDIYSLGVEIKPGIEDRVFAAVTYEDDTVGTFWHSFSRPGVLERTSMHFAFDLGEIDMMGWIPLGLNIWGWTDNQGAVTLQSLPGVTDLGKKPTPGAQTRSSDIVYPVEWEMTARVALDTPKPQVYSDSLRAIMADLIKAADDPSWKMKVTLDDGIEAVRTAEAATRIAHPRPS